MKRERRVMTRLEKLALREEIESTTGPAPTILPPGYAEGGEPQRNVGVGRIAELEA